MNLEGAICPIYYCSLLGEKLSEIQSVVQSMVYSKWDTSPESPPKTRPREASQRITELALDVLAFNSSAGKPVWPDVIFSRFTEGPELSALKELKAQFVLEFGNAVQTQSPTSTSRVTGSCDYGFDGKSHLDIERVIDLPGVPVADAVPERHGGNRDESTYGHMVSNVFPICLGLLDFGSW